MHTEITITVVLEASKVAAITKLMTLLDELPYVRVDSVVEMEGIEVAVRPSLSVVGGETP